VPVLRARRDVGDDVIRYRRVTTTCGAKVCGREIAFLRTAKGRPMPVDGDSLTTADREALARREELAYRHGEHVTHFSSCVARSHFSRTYALRLRIASVATNVDLCPAHSSLNPQEAP